MEISPSDISLETIEILCSEQLLKLPTGGKNGFLQ